MDVFDQLGYEEIEVRIALSVAMARQIDRHPVDMDCEIGAVIEIEPAQEILIGLAAAAMLGHDYARNHLEDFGRSEERAILQLVFLHGALACGVGLSGKTLLVRSHYDAFTPWKTRRRRRRAV